MASSIINIEVDALDFNVSGKLILRLSCRSLLERATSDGSFASRFPNFEDGEVISSCSYGIICFGVIMIGWRALTFELGETSGRTLRIQLE